MMLQLFPGRTPEELDNVDWKRLQAARHALEIRRVEELRIAHQSGLIKGNQLTPADWEAIAEHERILAAWPSPE